MNLAIGLMPPQAIDMEEVVLGAVLLEQPAYNEIAEIFTPELFYKEKHSIIAKAIIDLKNKGDSADILTVTAELRRIGKLEDIGGPLYICQLTNRIASSANIVFHTRILQQYSIKREVIAITANAQRMAYDDGADVFDLIDVCEQGITKMTSKVLTSKTKDLKFLYSESVDRNAAIFENKNGISGIPSGFIDIDNVTGGWQKSDLIILAARPGMGKTALALSLARNPAVNQNKSVAIFSLEMSSGQLMNRLKSQESGFRLEKFMRTGLNDYEMQSVNEQCQNLINAPIFIDDSGGLTMFEMRNKARRLKREEKIELIIVDYLQLMSAGIKTNNKDEATGYISRNLKGLAKELDIPIIALAQLSREVEKRPGKVPQLSDLRDSGSIEQDADIVAFIYRPEYYGITEDGEGTPTAGKAMFMIAKHRNGSLENVSLNFKGENTKFYDDYQFNVPLPEENKSVISPALSDFNDDVPF